MITADLRFEGFDASAWSSLVTLFAAGVSERMEQEAAETDDPTAIPGDSQGEPRGSLVIVVDDDHSVLKAHHTLDGRAEGVRYQHPDDLPRLCREYSVRRAWVMQAGAAEELSERMAMHTDRTSSYLEQVLAVFRCFRDLADAGMVRVWPNPWKSIPIPSSSMVMRALDVALPVGHTAVFALWESRRIDTCIALRRGPEGIDWIAGPDLIERWAGPLGGDWRRDHRVLLAAVGRAMAPVHFGVFSERATVRSLLRNPSPGAWAQAVAVRDVILAPSPGFATFALGADALRGAAAVSKRALGGIDLGGLFAPAAQYVRARVFESEGIVELLGFNPLTVLAEAMNTDESESQDSSGDGS